MPNFHSVSFEMTELWAGGGGGGRIPPSDQFSYPVQEFMLKNDTLKNGKSRIGFHGSASPPLPCVCYPKDPMWNRVHRAHGDNCIMVG